MTTHSLPAGCLSSRAAPSLSHNALFPPHSRVHKRRHKTAGWGGGSWKPGTRTDVCVLWCHRLQAMDTFCFGPQVPLKPQVLRVIHLWAAGSRFSKWVAEVALLGCWRLAWDVSIGGGNETREPEGLSGHGEPPSYLGIRCLYPPECSLRCKCWTLHSLAAIRREELGHPGHKPRHPVWGSAEPPGARGGTRARVFPRARAPGQAKGAWVGSRRGWLQGSCWRFTEVSSSSPLFLLRGGPVT